MFPPTHRFRDQLSSLLVSSRPGTGAGALDMAVGREHEERFINCLHQHHTKGRALQIPERMACACGRGERGRQPWAETSRGGVLTVQERGASQGSPFIPASHLPWEAWWSPRHDSWLPPNAPPFPVVSFTRWFRRAPCLSHFPVSTSLLPSLPV